MSSASGTIATLNVPAGGTLNLGAGASVTTLTITGGTVNITGTGVQVATLLGSAGTIDASLHALTVTQSAELGGVTATLTGGTSFTLGGANLIAPSALNHTIITSTGGTLSFATTGLDAAIGISQPGTPARPTTATFSGNGAWALNGGAASDITSVYGRDNHAFHYMQVPSGNFDILVHVTGATNANVGLMARDTLTASVGNSAGIWTGLKATTMNGALTASDHATPGNPWLRIKKIGELVTTYESADGITYTQVQQQDYTAYPWGATTYIGLDLAQTTGAMGTAQGTYENVNFMGTASMPNWSTTELVLSGGAKASVDCKLKLGKLTINSVEQPAGAYTASNTPDSISGAGALIIGDNSATVTLGSLSQPYTGSPRSATATTTPTGLTVTFTYNGSATAPTALGDYTVVGTISDIFYEGSATGTLHITDALSDFQSWANGYLPIDVSIPTDDSDGDGLNNQQEYAFGLDPTKGSSVNPITQQLDKATRTFKYTRRATSGLNYSYEWSTTLSNPWDVLTPDGSPSSNNATPVEEITVTVPAALINDNPKLFLRVKALP